MGLLLSRTTRNPRYEVTEVTEREWMTFLVFGNRKVGSVVKDGNQSKRTRQLGDVYEVGLTSHKRYGIVTIGPWVRKKIFDETRTLMKQGTNRTDT